jgi:hypothetical protein
MDLKINEPEIEMGGGQVIRSGNENRPMSMITFHSRRRRTRSPLIEALFRDDRDGDVDIRGTARPD